MTLNTVQSTHSTDNAKRLEKLKDFYNLKEDYDAVTLGLRVLEFGMNNGKLCYMDDDDDVYIISIG